MKVLGAAEFERPTLASLFLDDSAFCKPEEPPGVEKTPVGLVFREAAEEVEATEELVFGKAVKEKKAIGEP